MKVSYKMQVKTMVVTYHLICCIKRIQKTALKYWRDMINLLNATILGTAEDKEPLIFNLKRVPKKKLKRLSTNAMGKTMRQPYLIKAYHIYSR